MIFFWPWLNGSRIRCANEGSGGSLRSQMFKARFTRQEFRDSPAIGGRPFAVAACPGLPHAGLILVVLWLVTLSRGLGARQGEAAVYAAAGVGGGFAATVLAKVSQERLGRRGPHRGMIGYELARHLAIGTAVDAVFLYGGAILTNQHDVSVLTVSSEQ